MFHDLLFLLDAEGTLLDIFPLCPAPPSSTSLISAQRVNLAQFCESDPSVDILFHLSLYHEPGERTQDQKER